MKKKIYAISNLVLSSLIALLGFGSCKTPKVEMKDKAVSNTNQVVQPTDTVSKPKPQRDIRVLYGPPPVREEEWHAPLRLEE